MASDRARMCSRSALMQFSRTPDPEGLRQHLPQKIRLYELARELGMTNQEVLDLCETLGIGVKSHSSSIVE
ncbi:MAG: hypothetical protein GEV08_15130, partial [Acidimicrobiia bacterium]|nr:hypothetical protein [Acidimicrobiia bacterium]